MVRRRKVGKAPQSLFDENIGMWGGCVGGSRPLTRLQAFYGLSWFKKTRHAGVVQYTKA